MLCSQKMSGVLGGELKAAESRIFADYIHPRDLSIIDIRTLRPAYVYEHNKTYTFQPEKEQPLLYRLTERCAGTPSFIRIHGLVYHVPRISSDDMMEVQVNNIRQCAIVEQDAEGMSVQLLVTPVNGPTITVSTKY